MARSPHTYRAFGLCLASDRPVPGLPMAPAGQAADVVVSFEPELPPGAEGYRFTYADGAEFLVDSDGTCVRCRWQTSSTMEDLAIYLVGPVLGFLLRLRGTVPLHASAVEANGRAILFAGQAEVGKSTTAAAFASLGYGVISDDVVPIHEDGAEILACPGHPRVGVWPDAVTGLFGSPSALPRLSATYDKRYLDACSPGYRFAAEPIPIDAIYVLETRVPPGSGGRPRRLAPREALMALITNTYGNYVLDARMRARELDVLTRLATRTPVIAIAIEDDIVALPERCRGLAAQRVAAAGDRA